VKKLKIFEIQFRKSLIPNRACNGFGEFFQFFHSFSVTTGRKADCQSAIQPTTSRRYVKPGIANRSQYVFSNRPNLIMFWP